LVTRDDLKGLSDEELKLILQSRIGKPVEEQAIKNELDQREYECREEAFRAFVTFPLVAPAYLIRDVVNFLSSMGRPPTDPPARSP
jgi:hypothetical protein